MARCTALALAVLLTAAGSLAAEEDGIDKLSVDDILKAVEKRVAERREDLETVEDYRAFLKTEERKQAKWGERLASVAAKYRSKESGAYYLHLFSRYRASLDLLARLKVEYGKNARNAWRLQEVLIGIAWNYLYLGRPAEAQSALSSSRSSGFRNRVQSHFAKMAKFPAMKQLATAAYRKRDLAPRDPVAQWALCETLCQKTFFPLEERLELLWMKKAFPDQKVVKEVDLDWLLLQNAEKLLDLDTVVKGARSFLRSKKLQSFWAVKNGDVLWMLATAYQNQGKWKDAASTFEQLRTRHPKHPKVENGRVESLKRYVQGKHKSKAKPDPLPIEWGKGL